MGERRMTTIDRHQLDTMMRADAVSLVEVLDPEAYRAFHLPGAINTPLGDDFDARIAKAVSDRSSPVVVYCRDRAFDASSKAADRTAAPGYRRVNDYEAGKADWKNAGLPVER
jgi:rhodanese-related sulfurtransferase